MDIQTAASTTPTQGSTDQTPTILAGEHAMLLRDVRGLADPILAQVDARCWPEPELRALTRYLRTAVLGQATAEEALFYPAGTNAPFAELSAQHVALHTLTNRLDNADSGSCTLPQLAELVAELAIVFEHHLAAEQNLLEALEGPHIAQQPVEIR